MNKDIIITQEDFDKYCKFAYARVTQSKSRGVKPLLFNVCLWLLMSVVFIVFMQTTEFTLSSFHWPTAVLVSFSFLMFIFIYFVKIRNIQKHSFPEQDGLILGKRTLEIDDSGIKDLSQHGSSLYYWKSLKEVAEDEGSVYLFLDTMLAQIIPASAFGDKEERSTFIEKVRALHCNALKGDV